MEENTTCMYIDSSLKQNSRLTSSNAEYYLTLDEKGILRIFQSDNQEVWNNSSKVTSGEYTQPFKLTFEAQHLCVKDTLGRVNWQADFKEGREGYRLEMADEGYPVVFDESGVTMWKEIIRKKSHKEDAISVKSFFERLDNNLNYQHYLILLLFCSGIAFSTFSSITGYMMITPPLVCDDLTNPQHLYTSCSVKSACSGKYIYKADPNTFTNWLIDYQLMCDKTYINDVIVVLGYIGLILGSALFMPLADKYGRKQLLTQNMIGTSLVCLKIITSEDLLTLVICVFLLGMLTSVYYNIAYMMALECSSISHRAYYTCIIFSSAPIGKFLVVPLLFKYHQWKTVMIIVTVMIFALITIISTFVDSPRYYISRYDYTMATVSAKRICNKEILFEECERTFTLNKRKWLKRREEETYPFSELFTYPSVQAATYIMVICCFNFNNMYKGMVLLSDQIVLSEKYSAMLSAVLDFFACILAAALLTKFGRSAVIQFSFNITCLLAIAISFIPAGIVSITSALLTLNRYLS